MSPDTLKNVNNCIGDTITYTRIDENLGNWVWEKFLTSEKFWQCGTLYDCH